MITLFTSIITKRRQKLIQSSIEVVCAHIREITRVFETNLSSFNIPSNEFLMSISHKIISQVKKEQAISRSKLEVRLLKR